MLSFLSPADHPVIEELEKNEIVFAKNQPEYNPLRVLRGQPPECPVLSRWTLTNEQRLAIAQGADIYLELLTFTNENGVPGRLQPIRIAVGQDVDPDYIREQYGL